MDRMTDQEISDLFAAYDKAVLNGTANTQEWADRIKDARAGIQGYTQAMRASQQALKSSMLGLGTAMADGETGATVFNDGIKSGANTVSTWLSSKGPVGAAIGTLVKATAAYVGAINKQADSLYKSYQDISRTGVIGQGGVRDVYDNMQKFGYGIKELDKFGSLMAENSKELSNFGGTAIDGAKAFANLAYELQHSPITADLLNMGISVDEINKGAAGFVRQQTMMGRNQKDIGDKLTASTLKYINELETISRLTGQTRKEQEDKIADAMAEQAFNATIRSLRRKEAEGDIAAGKQADKFEAANQVLEGDMRKQFIKGVGGDIGALGPLLNIAGGDLVDAIQNPSRRIGDVLGSINDGYKKIRDSGGEQLQMINAFDDTFGKTLEYERLNSKLSEKNIDQLMEEAKINKQTTNAETKNLTATEISQRNARDNLQDFVNFGINPVTDVMKILAKALEFLTDLLPGSGKARKQYEMEQKDNALRISKQLAPEGASKPGSVPSGTTSSAPVLTNKIMMAESGGRNIDNQSGPGGKATSTASGLYQFTKGTFEGLASKAVAGSALYGKTFEDYKKDTNLQTEAMNLLMEQNRRSLSSKGLGTSDANMYLAHFLGAAGAAKALSADPGAPLTSVMSQDQLNANPSLKSLQTVGDLQAWAEKKMSSIPSGPTSGYEAKVTPGVDQQPRAALSTPKTAQTQIAEAETNANEIMQAQVLKMNDIVRIMEKQVAIQGKIYQRAAS